MDLGLPWELQSSLLPSGEGAETIRMQSASQAEKGGPASSFTRTEGAPTVGDVWPHTTMATRPEDSLRWSYRAEKSTRQQSDLLKLAVLQGQFTSLLWASESSSAKCGVHPRQVLFQPQR